MKIHRKSIKSMVFGVCFFGHQTLWLCKLSLNYLTQVWFKVAWLLIDRPHIHFFHENQGLIPVKRRSEPIPIQKTSKYSYRCPFIIFIVRETYPYLNSRMVHQNPQKISKNGMRTGRQVARISSRRRLAMHRRASACLDKLPKARAVSTSAST